MVVLYSTGSEPDWPDALDPYTGVFTYYGDNRSPGRGLENTPNKGNLLLSRVFDWAHGDAVTRAEVPPFFLFDKYGSGRDVRFRGLLAPGADRLSGEEDLVAIWRTTNRQRFQNYRATFTVLCWTSLWPLGPGSSSSGREIRWAASAQKPGESGLHPGPIRRCWLRPR